MAPPDENMPPEDVEWDDGTQGLDVPPPDVEWGEEQPVEAAPAPAADDGAPAYVPYEAPSMVDAPAESEAPAAAQAAPRVRLPPEDPGFLKAAGRGLLQGFFKQGADELAGAMAEAGTDLGPHARYRMPDGTTRALSSGDDVYRAVRDTEREIERGAREYRPKTAFLANMAGDIASDAALSALGVPVANSAYQAASGALSGFLGSDTDLTGDNVPASEVLSAANSTAFGGLAGYYAPKVGAAVARAAPSVLARFRQWLDEQAIDKARKVITSGADQLANRKPLADASVREALDSGAIVPFGTTKGAFQRLEALAEQRGANYGGILERLQAAGVQGPAVDPIAQRLAAAAEDSAVNSGANKAVSRAFAGEADNVRNVAPPGFALLGEYTTPITTAAPAPSTAFKTRDARGRYIPMAQRLAVVPDAPPPAPPQRTFTPYEAPVAGPTGGRLPLDQAERIKRALQDEAKYGLLSDTPVNEAKKEIAYIYRDAIEGAVDEAGMAATPGSEVAELASEFLPVKQQLARTLDARDHAMRGAARSAQRVGGAAGISLFDLANATQATGSGGLPALALAGASRVWKERGPSTLANVYDVSAEAAGNLSRWTAANPATTRDASTRALGLGARQGLAARGEGSPEDAAQTQSLVSGEGLYRFAAQNPDAFGPYGAQLSAAAAMGPQAFALQDYMLAQTQPEYAERRRQLLQEATGQPSQP